MRERCVDVQPLLGDLRLLGRRQAVERPHVVGAIGELDQDDPEVAAHREQHLPEVLRLVLLARAEVDLADLGDSVDELRDLGAEERLELAQGRESLLDGVLEPPGRDARHVEAEIGDDARDRERV
jgi:hypothetical protein